MSVKGKIKDVLYQILPLNMYLSICFYNAHGRKLDLKTPKSYSEKLFWLKIYNGEHYKKTIQKCYDKYNAREYIAERVGEHHLPKLYGIFDTPDDIDFEQLPSKYAIKITQSCGYNIINDGKSDLNLDEIKKQLTAWQNEVNDLNKCKKLFKEESYYYTGNAKIICEEFLEDKNGNVCVDSGFFCFNGVPKFYDIVYDSIDFDSGLKYDDFPRNVYDMEGNYIPVEIGRPTDESLGRREYKNFREMEDIARKLSQDFPFVRVDLYNRDGEIIVGELTWIPQGGGGRISPVEYDYEFGKWLKLPGIDY